MNRPVSFDILRTQIGKLKRKADEVSKAEWDARVQQDFGLALDTLKQFIFSYERDLEPPHEYDNNIDFEQLKRDAGID